MGYREEVLADRPIGFWRNGAQVGSTERDLVAGRDATYSGSPSLGQPGLFVGDSNPSVLFAASKYAQVASNAAFTLTDVVIEAWLFRTGALPAADAHIVTHQNASYALRVLQSTGNLTFTNVNVANYGTGFAIASNKLYHCVAVVVGTALTVWVNGVLVYSTTISALAANASALDIGNDHNVAATGYFPGQIQDVAIYAALSPARVLAHYRAGIGEGRFGDRRRIGRAA